MNLGEEQRELQVEPVQWPQPQTAPQIQEPSTIPQRTLEPAEK